MVVYPAPLSITCPFWGKVIREAISFLMTVEKVELVNPNMVKVVTDYRKSCIHNLQLRLLLLMNDKQMLRQTLLHTSRKKMPVHRLAHNEKVWKKNRKRHPPVETAFAEDKPYIYFTAEEGRALENEAARIAENIWRYGTTSIGMTKILSDPTKDEKKNPTKDEKKEE